MRIPARLWQQGCLLATLFVSGLVPAQGPSQAISEYAVKSAMWLRLPPFIYRPAVDRATPLSMCLLGRNYFGAALDKLSEQTVEGRPVKVSRLGSVAEAAACEFLFISRSEERQLGSILRRLEDWPVVTLSDIDGFARAGGMIELAVGSEGGGQYHH